MWVLCLQLTGVCHCSAPSPWYHPGDNSSSNTEDDDDDGESCSCGCCVYS